MYKSENIKKKKDLLTPQPRSLPPLAPLFSSSFIWSFSDPLGFADPKLGSDVLDSWTRSQQLKTKEKTIIDFNLGQMVRSGHILRTSVLRGELRQHDRLRNVTKITQESKGRSYTSSKNNSRFCFCFASYIITSSVSLNDRKHKLSCQDKFIKTFQKDKRT